MKNKDIRCIKNLSIELNKFFEEHARDDKRRIKKTSILDGFMFKLLQGQKELSSTKATFALNNFK